MFAKPLLTVVALLVAASAAHAEEWAHLKGRFILQGEPPRVIEREHNMGGRVVHFRDESIVAGKKGELKNIVVWLRTKVDAVAPQYSKTAADTVTLEAKDDRFEPHVVSMRTTQTLKIKNSQNFEAFIKIDARRNEPLSTLLDVGGESSHRLGWPETMPVSFSDAFCPFLSGFLVVRDDPYVAISDAEGKFLIESLPAGVDLEFQLWQEKIGFLKYAVMQSTLLDSKGRFKIKLEPGTKDLGSIKVPDHLIPPPVK